MGPIPSPGPRGGGIRNAGSTPGNSNSSWGNTLRRADSLQTTGGLTTQSEPAPVVQEPAGRMLSTRATQHHSIGLPWPKTLSRTLSHSHSIWAQAGALKTEMIAARNVTEFVGESDPEMS